MKVLCDHMVGSLATWLRILGVDTEYPASTVSDDEILRKASAEGRLILTRDKTLVARAKKKGIPVVLLSSTGLMDQLQQVLDVIPIDTSSVLSRCTVCNTVLESVEAMEAKSHVPVKVFERQTRFWLCPSCQKYYWMGTHYEDMQKRIAALVLEKKGSA